MRKDMYYKATQVDREYDRAIKEQFGRHATRWTVKKQDFNEETKRIYQKRLNILSAYFEWEKKRIDDRN